MRRILTAFGLSILMVVTVSAQSSGPEEPDIMLPPMVLEIEDVSEESVQAALPDIWDPVVPELSIPLPEAEAISVSESVFDIELIDEMLPSGEGQDVKTSSFASEGMIGAGASNHIIGDVSLYKLGKSPRFSIHFYHEGMDGYGKRSPGEGFFFSDDAIDAEFSHTADKTDFSLSAGYSEEEDGLQDLASAYSVKHRILSGTSAFTYEPRDRLSLGGGFSFESLNKLLTGTLPEEDSELILRPSVQAGLSFPGFKAGFSADYRFRSLSVDSSSSDDNWLRSALSFHWAVSFLDIGGNVGLAWDFGDAFYVPFSVDLSGAVRDILSFSVSGGFAFEEAAWSGILRENPYIALNGLLGPACGYFGRLDLRGNIGKALSITAGGDLRFLSGALVPDYSSFVNGMYSLTPEDRTLLSLSSGLPWSSGEVSPRARSGRGISSI
jgi:hypothetical protein